MLDTVSAFILREFLEYSVMSFEKSQKLSIKLYDSHIHISASLHSSFISATDKHPINLRPSKPQHPYFFTIFPSIMIYFLCAVTVLTAPFLIIFELYGKVNGA